MRWRVRWMSHHAKNEAMKNGLIHSGHLTAEDSHGIPEESPNFCPDWEAKDQADQQVIAQVAMLALVEVYGYRPKDKLGMELYLGEASAWA